MYLGQHAGDEMTQPAERAGETEQAGPSGGYFDVSSLVLYGIREPVIGPFRAWETKFLKLPINENRASTFKFFYHQLNQINL